MEGGNHQRGDGGRGRGRGGRGGGRAGGGGDRGRGHKGRGGRGVDRGGSRGGRSTYGRRCGEYHEEKKVSPGEVWQLPPLPTTPPIISPLAPPKSPPTLPTPANEICLQIPKAPGNISFANIDCSTNYYELGIGQTPAAYRYSVTFTKVVDADAEQNASKLEPRKQFKRPIFDLLPREEIGDQMMAFDGQQRAWSLHRIPNDSATVIVNYGNQKWQITLDYEKCVPFTGVKAGQEFGLTKDIEEVLSALSIMMTHVISSKYTAVGRGFYNAKKPLKPISGGLELAPGFKIRIIPSIDKLYLNVNYTTAAFIQPKNLIELLLDLLHQGQIPPWPLHPKVVADLRKMILTCKAQTTHLKKPRDFTIVWVTEKPATEVSFIDKDDSEITVAAYFEKTYGQLKYPHLPCVQDGVKKPRYYPFEVVKITRGNPYRGEQSEQFKRKMRENAAIDPRNRLEKIRTQVSDICKQPELATEFDLTVREELQLPTRILPPSKLSAEGTPGVINFGTNALHAGSFINKWTIIITDESADENDVKKFADVLVTQGRNLGVDLQAPSFVAGKHFHSVSDKTAFGNFEQRIESFVKQNHLEFVLFVISKQSPIHASIKFVCDIKLSVASKCVKTATIEKVCSNDRHGPDQCIVNILYGLNPKFNGENVVGIDTEFGSNFLRTNATLIIGIDVNHGEAGIRDGVPKMPSTVGIVGTRNLNATLYTAFMKAQRKPETSNDREIVQEAILKPAVVHLFENFYKETGTNPERVIVFRDGISDGQFKTVLDKEMRTIIEVSKGFSAGQHRPPITFITVQKRHETRLFPKKVTLDNRGREKQNPVAGTVVDSVITNPKVWNFFLVSHEGIQGTSRPAHYSVLYDENDFSNDQLQSLSYYLCHLYSKCPRTVSLPAPTYYAHHVAFRAAKLGAYSFYQSSENVFARPQATGSSGYQNLEEKEKEILRIYNEALQMTPDFAKSMYFL